MNQRIVLLYCSRDEAGMSHVVRFVGKVLPRGVFFLTLEWHTFSNGAMITAYQFGRLQGSHRPAFRTNPG